MKIRTLENGTLVLEERLTLLRWGAGTGALALVAVLAQTAIVRGALTTRELLGCCLGLAGLFALAALVADRTFRFERFRSRVQWTVRRLFVTRTGELPFEDVIRVTLRASVDTESRTRRVNYQPILLTRAGDLPLSSFHSLDPGDSASLARTIGEILGRPLEAPREATVEELVAAHRTIEAVAHVRRERGLDLTAAKAVVDSVRDAQRAAGKTAA